MNDHVSIKQLLGKYTIDIPGNGIDHMGIETIQYYLRRWGFGEIPEDKPLPPSKDEYWKWDWKVPGKGEYVGTLPKRIGKLIYQCTGEKLSAERLSELGNIGATHSGRHCKYWFDIVDDIDWGQEDFGQPDDCCYWGCHAGAKHMILDNGGGAIRFFNKEQPKDSYRAEDGFARAWLAPWEDCWIVFNGYGLDTLVVTRILAAHLNHAYYRRIRLSNNRETQGALWINGCGTGFLVGPQESVLKWETIDLKWEDLNRLECENCDTAIDEINHYHSPDEEDYCEDCYSNYVFFCQSCEENHWIRDARETPDNELLCLDCWKKEYFHCHVCGVTHPQSEGVENVDGDYFCRTCYYGLYGHCDDCWEDYLLDDMVYREDGHYCEECAATREGEATVV